MASTGKPVAFEGMLMFRVRDGKVVEAWNSFDFLKLFQQMGVVKLAGGRKILRSPFDSFKKASAEAKRKATTDGVPFIGGKKKTSSIPK